MFKVQGLTAILIPLISTGCSVGPGLPPLTTLPIKASRAQASPLPDRWWQLYQDADINQAVEQALSNNRSLRVAAAKLLEARAVLNETADQRLPVSTFTASAGYGSTVNDQIAAAQDQSGIRTGSRYGIGMDVLWEVDLFGRLRSLSRAAEADARSAQAAEDGVRVDVAAETTRAWLDSCSDAQQIRIARDSLRLAQHGQQIAEAMHQSGAGVVLDVVRAQSQVEQAQASLPLLQAAQRNSLAELAVLMGRLPNDPPAAAVSCQSPPTLVNAVFSNTDGMGMLSRRPDVLQAQQRLIAATAKIDVATADLYPRISIGSSVFTSAPQPKGWDKSAATVWSVGPLVSWSFPNISQARSRVAQAGAEENAALAKFDGTLLEALKEVQQDLNTYDAVLQQQHAVNQANENSQRALKIAEFSWRDGATTALDYLDAQRSDIAVQSQLAQVNVQVINAQVSLFKALGGGWQQAPAIALPSPKRAIANSQISMMTQRENSQ